MIDLFLLVIWLSLAGITFLLVYIGLFTAKWEKPDETTEETVQETKPKRTLWQWVVTVLLVVSGLLALGSFFLFQGFCFYILILVSPIAGLILFVICLIRYIRVRRKQKRCPEEVSPEEVKFHKTCMIVFAVLFIAVLAVFLVLLFLPAGDVAYM